MDINTINLAVQTVQRKIKDPNSGIRAELNTTFAGKADVAAAKQAALYGAFMKKLRTGVAVTIAAMGDSTTYGHDTASGDKVAADPVQLPDGTYHSFTRSPAPWPAVLQTRLTEVYPAGVTVINRGRSGDTAEEAYPRWVTSSGADLVMISYGINDATASDNLTKGDITAYINDYERLIQREIITRNAAVVILQPTKSRDALGDVLIDVYRTSIDALAAKYGIPVIDLQSFLAGYATDVYSDAVHLNTKGNSIIAARLAATFIGQGPARPNKVSAGTKLSVRPVLDNVVFGPNSGLVRSGGTSNTPTEGTANTTAIYGQPNIGGVDGAFYYSFYTEAADVIAVPIYYIPSSSTLTVSLDFGVEQPHDIMNSTVGVTSSHAAREASSFVHTGGSGFYQSTVDAASRKIRVASPGWHTLKIAGSAALQILVHGVEFVSYRAYKNTVDINSLPATVYPSYHLPVPATFDEATDILTTRVSVAAVLARLGIADWGSQSYKAPAFKVTIRSYGNRVIEYLLAATMTGTNNGAFEKVVELRNTALITTPTETFVREIGTVTLDTATKEWVFTWKTLLADGTTAKNMKRNFVMEITIL